MNTSYLWAVPVVLALGVAGWLALRRRPGPLRRRPVPAGPAGQPADDAAAEAALRASIQAAIQVAGDGSGPALNAATTARNAARNAAKTAAHPVANPAASVLAQRHAATEALRQARRRMADEAVRLEADRLAQQAAPPPTPPQRALRPAAAPSAGSALPPLSAHPFTAAPITARPPAPTASPVRRPAEPAGPAVSLLGPQSIQLAGGRAPGQRPPLTGLAPLRPPGPPTVLVADDSKVVRVKTGRLLEKQGWRVLLAEDGQAALHLLQTESPDLLVTDVEMPGLDGFELTRRLRASARWARLPVIMVTSSDDKHRDEAFAVGVNVLLGKPYADEALVAQAQQLLPSALRRAEAGTALH